MMKNNIVVIPFNLPWEWSTDYTNQTAFVLSKKNIVICYMAHEANSIKESLKKGKLPSLIRKISQNIYIFEPIYVIPFRRFNMITKLNSFLNILLLKLLILLLKIRIKTNKKIVWIFDPDLYHVCQALGKSFYVVYDCVDYFAAAHPKRKRELLRKEKLLLARVDLIVAISKVLQRHLSKMTTKKVHLVPQGFRIKDFEKIAPSYRNIKRGKPIIGFAGGVNSRIDYNFLLKLVKRNPNWDFVVWGPLLEKEKFDKYTQKKFEELLITPNVITGKVEKREQIPGILTQFDVAMIPYDSSQDFNKYCYPMKIFEFFYLGKPVVSTYIEELQRFPDYVKISDSVYQWEKIINDYLSKPWPINYQKGQRKLAEQNSWERKIGTIAEFVF